MKKGDAAATAEPRLAQAKRLPELPIDQTVPIVNYFDPDDKNEDRDETDSSDNDMEDADPQEDSETVSQALFHNVLEDLNIPIPLKYLQAFRCTGTI